MPSITDPDFTAMAAMVAAACQLPGPPITPKVSDWGGFLSLCRRHHVVPLVFQEAWQWPGLPAELLDGLRGAARNAAQVGLGQIAALAEIIDALRQAGIRFLVVKGVPLSVMLFGDPARRSSGDIDLLLAPDDFATGRRILHALGYRTAVDTQTLDEDVAASDNLRELTMFRGNIQIELHRRLTDNPRRLPVHFDTLYAGRRMVTVSDVLIPTLGPGHCGLYLFVHGAGHGWERLAWIVDIALFCRDPGMAADLVSQLRSLGMERAAGQAFALIHRLLGAPPPPGIRVPANPGWLTRRLAAGHAGQRQGRAWIFRIICMRWAGWRMRGGLGPFYQELTHDLGSPVGRTSPSRLGPQAWLCPVTRLASFLWRNRR